MNNVYEIDIVDKFLPFYTEKARYKVAYGGRGGAKTENIARILLIIGLHKKTRILCTREYQTSIRDSVHKTLKDIISLYPSLFSGYEVQKDTIKHENGTEFIFKGLQNINEIKSIQGIDICWVEEAANVSKNSWDILSPTIRAKDSEIWISFNPMSEDDWTYKRFILKPDDTQITIFVNFYDNPFFPEVLEMERLHCLHYMPEAYDWVWLGACRKISDSIVFSGRYDTYAFEPAYYWDGPYLGGDFGFSQDPTAAIECWIHEGTLYIRREAGKVGLEIDDTPNFIIKEIPAFKKAISYWDNARPESISLMKRYGMPLARACEKGKGSIEDGIEHIKSYKIVVHPECKNILQEFRLYSYKVDRLSGDIKPIVVDKHNHYIDALRYALEPIMKNQTVNWAAQVGRVG